MSFNPTLKREREYEQTDWHVPKKRRYPEEDADSKVEESSEAMQIEEEEGPKAEVSTEIFAVTAALIQNAQEDFNKGDLKVVQRAMVASGPYNLARNMDVDARLTSLFAEKIKHLGSVTDQRSSGRCWIFAGCNLLRRDIIKKFNLKDFEFSKTHLYFWDKFEKANAFLARIIKTSDEHILSRDVQDLLSSPCPDGAWWECFVNVVEKYGMMPKSAMEETYNSKRSTRMNSYLGDMLRNYARELRDKSAHGVSQEELVARKDEMLKAVYRILAINLGEPPERFDWEYKDKDNKIHQISNVSPKEFVEQNITTNLDSLVSIAHSPLPGDPREYQQYIAEDEHNVIDGELVGFIGVPKEVLWKAAMDSIKDKQPVWFACDVGADRDATTGKMSRGLWDFESIYGDSVDMTKAERIAYGVNSSNHAMVLSAVEEKDGRPVKWQVMNSWGDDSGKNGYFIMDQDWFENYVYNVIVDEKYLPRRVLDVREQDAILLGPDDPMCRANHDHKCSKD